MHDNTDAIVSSNPSPASISVAADADYNIFRHSLLRYLGYANEVGEAFRYQAPRLVRPSYMVAFGYCLADAGSTGYTVSQNLVNHKHQVHDTVHATVDTLAWQLFASVALPGVTINMIVKLSRAAVRQVALPILVATWLPTVVGLGSIPFIVHPIDAGVDYALDSTLRQWWIPRKDDK